MENAKFSASAELDAPAEAVYATITDYRDRHPRIVPNPPFVKLEVLEGGTGAGTVIGLEMKVLGRTQVSRGTVTEPEPGRLLVEAYDNGYVTSFLVEPLDGGRRARVTITTDLGRGGVRGQVERWMVGRLLGPVYQEELGNLERVARDGRPEERVG